MTPRPPQRTQAGDPFHGAALRLVQATANATAASANEQNLRYAVEAALERECAALDIPWIPYQLDRALRDAKGNFGFADVVHGAIIIEYEPPRSFNAGRAGARVAHAKDQAEDYAQRMARNEGRLLSEYVLVICDGAHVAFGRITAGDPAWERLQLFSPDAAERLLRLLRDQGRPLVHPGVLRTLIGPDSQVGADLIPVLFQAACAAEHVHGGATQTKTTLLYKEWRRLFGQAVGIQTERLGAYLDTQSRAHRVQYTRNIPAYLFTLHTYLAVVAKLAAALALPNAAEDMADMSVPLLHRMRALESGQFFADAGVTNMLSGDFFSWYVDDAMWPDLEGPLARLLNRLQDVSFDLAHKQPESVRDLFKGIYEVFVPRELRHALGEVYTPDWLAAHALDQLGWQPKDDLLDPTCGSGTFLLEAVKRRFMDAQQTGRTIGAASMLRGLYGMDLNPLAVLAAKASVVVVLASRLEPGHPVTLPIYLADAINPASEDRDGFFVHILQTEVGNQRFEIPAALVRSDLLFSVFDQFRRLINAGLAAQDIVEAVASTLEPLQLSTDARMRIEMTVQTLVNLHGLRWDGIWCPILADRFAAGAIPRVSHIAGNPPWVKWSHLPPAYASFIKPLCRAMNVFSRDRYVGGIESDISTVITFQAIRTWLAPRGRLGFFITATVFSNESSQGFRRFETHEGEAVASILAVEDYKEVAPFEGVTNHPALLLLEQGQATRYPVPYRIWTPRAGGRQRRFESADEFRAVMAPRDLVAAPVPGSDAGPWLKGTAEDHLIWETLFDAGQDAHYQARKGVTTDLNGAYFVRATPAPGNDGLVWVQNDPAAGRKGDLPRVRPTLVEAMHVFPLMRGRGLSAFRVQPDPDYKVIVPQRGMNGDPTLPVSAQRTHRYFSRFETQLRARGSYRRYQAKHPYWSTWSTGSYTFSNYKVLWKEMSGSRFCAAYVGSVNDPTLGQKVMVPDHKLYFVPVDSLLEAAYLTGLLNAPVISSAISGYAAQLSLGTSVIENLKIPPFDAAEAHHAELAEIAITITERGDGATAAEAARLSQLALAVVSGHAP